MGRGGHPASVPLGGAIQTFYKTGYYYTSPGHGVSTGALALNRMQLTPFDVAYSKSFDRIGIEVTGNVASSTLRFVVYADDGAGYPAGLLLDTGATAMTDTAVAASTWVEATISLTLGPGRYWIGAVTQTAASQVRQHATSGPSAGVGFTTGASAVGNAGLPIAWSLDSVSGAPPSTFTAGQSARGSAAQVWLRAA